MQINFGLIHIWYDFSCIIFKDAMFMFCEPDELWKQLVVIETVANCIKYAKQNTFECIV